MVSDGGAEPRVSVTAQNHSLTELLSELAHRAKINLSIVGEIERRVTVRLADQTVEEILTALAQTTGYTYRLVNGIHYFGKAEIHPDRNSTPNPLIQRKTVWLKHLPAKEVLNLLPASIPKQNITVSQVHNTVTIVGSPAVVAETQAFLAELDRVDDAIRGRQAEGAIAIEVSGEVGKQRLTVDILNASLFDVMRQLSIQTGTDMVFLRTDGTTQTLETEAKAPPALTANTVTLRRTDSFWGQTTPTNGQTLNIEAGMPLLHRIKNRC